MSKWFMVQGWKKKIVDRNVDSLLDCLWLYSRNCDRGPEVSKESIADPLKADKTFSRRYPWMISSISGLNF